MRWVRAKVCRHIAGIHVPNARSAIRDARACGRPICRLGNSESSSLSSSTVQEPLADAESCRAAVSSVANPHQRLVNPPWADARWVRMPDRVKANRVFGMTLSTTIVYRLGCCDRCGDLGWNARQSVWGTYVYTRRPLVRTSATEAEVVEDAWSSGSGASRPARTPAQPNALAKCTQGAVSAHTERKVLISAHACNFVRCDDSHLRIA